MATDIKHLNLNKTERSELEQVVDGDGAGCGIIQSNKYYCLAYRRLKDSETNLKCVGVELFVKNLNERYGFRVESISVPYKQKKKMLGFSAAEPFKDRLASAIKDRLDYINRSEKEIDNKIAREFQEKIDREKAIQEQTEKIRSCQIKIDETIKTLAPNAKSMIEYNHERMLAEKACFGAIPDEDEQPDIFPRKPNHKYNYINCACDQIKQKYDPNKEYESDKVRQDAINEAALNSMCNNSTPNDAFITAAVQTYNRNKCKNHTIEPGIYPLKHAKEAADAIKEIEAQLVLPTDPNYLTSFEKQQIQSDATIEHAVPNVAG